jgi:hypothetical protein
VQQAQVGQGQQLTVSATRTSQVAKKGACYGCGAPLQTDIASGPGYVRPDKYDLKARHKQLNQVRRWRAAAARVQRVELQGAAACHRRFGSPLSGRLLQ